MLGSATKTLLKWFGRNGKQGIKLEIGGGPFSQGCKRMLPESNLYDPRLDRDALFTVPRGGPSLSP